MRNKDVQLSLYDTYTDVLNKMEEHKSELIELLEKYINFDAIIPQQFYYLLKLPTRKNRKKPINKPETDNKLCSVAGKCQRSA